VVNHICWFYCDFSSAPSNAFCLKFRGDLLRVIIVVVVMVEALIIEGTYEEVRKDMIAAAIKIRHLRVL